MQEITGMAPTPEQMERLRSARSVKPTSVEGKKKKRRGSSGFVRVIVDSPSLKSEVQQILFGTHWMYQKRLLDILKIVTDNEKWETVRTIVMDIQTEQVDTQHIMIGQRITDYIAKEAKEAKENKENGNGTRSDSAE